MFLQTALLVSLSFVLVISLNCIQQNDDYSPEGKSNETCLGDYCYVFAPDISGWGSPRQGCLSGPIAYRTECSYNYYDETMCICNDTDFCNSLTLARSAPATVLSVVECHGEGVTGKTTLPANACSWVDKTYPPELSPPGTVWMEQAGVGSSMIRRFPVPVHPFSYFYDVFFYNACYHFTDDPQYSTTMCTCNTTKCNEEMPFPIAEGTIECHRGGNPQTVGGAECGFQPTQDSCLGHFCFVLPEKRLCNSNGTFSSDIIYRKGCITLNEQGDYKLQSGHMFVSETDFYLCRRPFCNHNISTVMIQTQREQEEELLQLESLLETTTKATGEIRLFTIVALTVTSSLVI